MRTISTIALFFILSGVIAQNMKFSGQTDEFYLDFTTVNTENNLPVPEIIWKNPIIQNTNIDSRRYKLQLNVRSGKAIKEVTVFLNDYPLITQRGFAVVSVKSLNDFERAVDTEILLKPGENTIRVTASNKEGSTSTSIRKINVMVDEVMDNAMNRKDYALLFATDEYDHWDNLQNPINDISTISSDLEAIYGFEIEIVKNPSKREVLQKLREYTKKSYMPNDQLFIMFAGHGHFDALFNQGYLVCKDSKITDEERLSYISHNNIRSIIDNIPNKHILLTMDACFGGTFDPFIRSSAHRGYGIKSDELEQYEYINRKLKLRTRKFLTSGGKEYVSDGRPGQHSPFARKMLEAIRSYGGEDNVLTLSEIKSYVEKINPEPRFGEFGSDEPGSDFI
ncbi:MAG: caspase family protein, partial [Cyclobacteriaceae bacterium]|nr:caspase family protein [Cyclobacteriaceae bacterium]